MEGFARYVGVQGVLAVLITIAMIVMIFLLIPVPKEFWTLLGVSWGFYFAKNGGNVVNRIQGKDVSMKKGM